jgi:hypothetical protein
MAKLSDDALIGIVQKEIQNSVGFSNGKLAEMRRKSEYYYLGEAKGDLSAPEVDGRSSVVSTDVADTIEWMMPSLLKIFTASDNAVEFTPRAEKDEVAAKQATDYINYVFHKQNPGFQILYTWFKDALLQKNGFLKVYWDDKKDVTKEDYQGLDSAELTMLLEDEQVTPIKHSQYLDESRADQYAQAMQQYQQMAAQHAQAQQMGQEVPPQPAPPQEPILHDVTVQRTKDCSRVVVENVPPEEFRISRAAKSISDTPYCAHELLKTLSDLRAMGYKNVDNLSSSMQGNQDGERIERMAYDDDAAFSGDGEDYGDESQRRVWIVESYVKVDYDGDGIAEWRKIVSCGTTILDNEECDGPPFVSITPIPLPHRFFGLSMADLSMDAQKTKTSIWRALLDNLYLQVNGRYAAVDGQVNLDDLLTSRPGGIVRVKSAGAVFPLQQGLADSSAAYQALEYAETAKEQRTGFTRYSQGNSADSLNQTATGMNILTNRADSRTELIARVFAETGVKDLFLLILKLVSQYQNDSTSLRINGEWIPLNPREWATQFDFTVNVGLGTGNKDQTIEHLMALMQQQQMGLQVGFATPKNLYNSASKLAENMGFKQPDMYFSDPEKAPPAPPPPDPIAAQAQADIQVQQAKAEGDARIKEMQMQFDLRIKQTEIQMQAEKDRMQAQNDMQERQHKAMLDAQLAEQSLQFDRYKANLEAETRVMVARIGAFMPGTPMPLDPNDPAVISPEFIEHEAMPVEPEPEKPDSNLILAQVVQGFMQAVEKMNRPKVATMPDGRQVRID